MNRKNMPLLLMLVAGACTCIITMVRQYLLLDSLMALFFVMLLFYCLGSLIRWLLDRFDRQNEEKAKAEAEAAAIQEQEAAASGEDAEQKGVNDSNG